MRCEKVWVEQRKATRRIKRSFGAKSALDYLIGEKLVTFADVAEDRPEFAKELPRFLAAVWQVFNEYEIAGYVASRRPAARKGLRKLLYLPLRPSVGLETVSENRAAVKYRDRAHGNRSIGASNCAANCAAILSANRGSGQHGTEV